MASGCFVLAHENQFNKAVLKDNAIYYSSAIRVTELLDGMDDIISRYKAEFVKNNIDVIRREYSWEHLVDEHERYFYLLLEKGVK